MPAGITDSLAVRRGRRIHLRSPRFLKRGYRRTLRRILPRNGYRVLNGVTMPPAVTDRKLFDRVLNVNPDIQHYEGGLVRCHDRIQEGDDVAVVGGGLGITAVNAAKRSKTGRLIVYEGAEQQAETIRKVLDFNGITNYTVRPKIVGKKKAVYGEGDDGGRIPPEALPDTDVLELDCEGSELDIVRNLDYTPRLLIMELHPFNFDAGHDDIIDLLYSKGYEVTARYGHDGTPVNAQQFKELVKNSASGGPRYIASGARFPPVIAAEQAFPA